MVKIYYLLLKDKIFRNKLMKDAYDLYVENYKKVFNFVKGNNGR